jgi:hypothetical protein
MAETRAAANGIMPAILPNRTATACSGPHNYLTQKNIIKMTVHSLCHCNTVTQTTGI